MAIQEKIVRVGGNEVKVTRPTKLLFPKDGITKQDLVDYYRRIAPRMLPHLRGRPLTMERYPDGINKSGFIQQSRDPHPPDWIRTVTVKKKGGTVRHVVCENAATLVYLANLACVTPHVWLSRTERLELPDQMVFDLDPSSDDFDWVKAAAKKLKELLDHLGLASYVKTTGSRGLHVVVPLRPNEDFDSVRAFARDVAAAVVSQAPEKWTLEIRKSKRRGRVFLDTNRNAYAQTIAPAYAVRARRGAPVSVPLDWSELGAKDLKPDGVTIRSLFDRLKRIPNPWSDFSRRRVTLVNARRQLEELNGT